jgi:hypothetical protein
LLEFSGPFRGLVKKFIRIDNRHGKELLFAPSRTKPGLRPKKFPHLPHPVFHRFFDRVGDARGEYQ